MLGLYKNSVLYIKCPKNGCMTYTTFLAERGWKTINLFDPPVDLAKFTIFGHLTQPDSRHTKGLVQYLQNNPTINIDDSTTARLLVSGVFDEHTYSLHMMLGILVLLPINWIPLDVSIKKFGRDLPPAGIVYDGDALTNDFFKQQGFDYTVTINDRKNVSGPYQRQLQQQITQLKSTYSENYQKISKNFLEPDILLYNRTVDALVRKYETED